MSDTTEITRRVEQLGWYVPAGWKVIAATQLDDSYIPEDSEIFTLEEWIDWQFGEWQVVRLVVSVYDDKARCVAWASRSAVPSGHLPTGYYNPLHDLQGPHLEGVIDDAMFGAKGEIMALLNSPDSQPER